jgi:putative transposase
VKPRREPATRNDQTYFVTSLTNERRPLFRHERWSNLFLETLFRYRADHEFLLHEFVVMPDHVHFLITPSGSLEHAVQMIEGGFSRAASVQFESKITTWQRGFSDHRIRDSHDYEIYRGYIQRNPVKAKMCELEHEYRFGSACGLYELDACPRGLKPLTISESDGTAEAVPFQ